MGGLIKFLLLLAAISLRSVSAQDGFQCDYATDIDQDDDGLIELCDLNALDAVRYQLDGSVIEKVLTQPRSLLVIPAAVATAMSCVAIWISMPTTVIATPATKKHGRVVQVSCL